MKFTKSSLGDKYIEIKDLNCTFKIENTERNRKKCSAYCGTVIKILDFIVEIGEGNYKNECNVVIHDNRYELTDTLRWEPFMSYMKKDFGVEEFYFSGSISGSTTYWFSNVKCRKLDLSKLCIYKCSTANYMFYNSSIETIIAPMFYGDFVSMVGLFEFATSKKIISGDISNIKKLQSTFMFRFANIDQLELYDNPIYKSVDYRGLFNSAIIDNLILYDMSLELLLYGGDNDIFTGALIKSIEQDNVKQYSYESLDAFAKGTINIPIEDTNIDDSHIDKIIDNMAKSLFKDAKDNKATFELCTHSQRYKSIKKYRYEDKCLSEYFEKECLYDIVSYKDKSDKLGIIAINRLNEDTFDICLPAVVGPISTNYVNFADIIYEVYGNSIRHEEINIIVNGIADFKFGSMLGTKNTLKYNRVDISNLILYDKDVLSYDITNELKCNLLIVDDLISKDLMKSNNLHIKEIKTKEDYLKHSRLTSLDTMFEQVNS